MFWLNRCNIKRKDIVKLISCNQHMEVTYVNRGFFHDRIEVIYQKEDGAMCNLSGFHPDSLRFVHK